MGIVNHMHATAWIKISWFCHFFLLIFLSFVAPFVVLRTNLGVKYFVTRIVQADIGPSIPTTHNKISLFFVQNFYYGHAELSLELTVSSIAFLRSLLYLEFGITSSDNFNLSIFQIFSKTFSFKIFQSEYTFVYFEEKFRKLQIAKIKKNNNLVFVFNVWG